MDRRFSIVLAASLAFALILTLLMQRPPVPDQHSSAAWARQGMADNLMSMANGLALGFSAGCGALFFFARILSVPGSDVHHRDGAFECLAHLLVFTGMAVNDILDCIDAVRRSRPEILYLNISSVMLFICLACVKGRQLRNIARAEPVMRSAG
jgi:hypothetical protein